MIEKMFNYKQRKKWQNELKLPQLKKDWRF